jgi:hypothetical protein
MVYVIDKTSRDEFKLLFKENRFGIKRFVQKGDKTNSTGCQMFKL